MNIVARKTVDLLFVSMVLVQPAQAQLMLTHMFHEQHSGCRVEGGNYAVEFAASQMPAAGQRAPTAQHAHCDHLPGAGPVRLIVDLVDHEERSMPLTMRLVKVTSDGEKAILTVPGKTYAVGFASIETTLADEGQYALHLDFASTEHNAAGHLRIPLHVGGKDSSWIARMTGALLLILTLACGVAALSAKARALALSAIHSWRWWPTRSKPR